MRPPPSIARTVFGRNKKTPLGMQAKTAFDRRAFGRDKKRNASIPDGVSGKRLKREIGNGAPNTKGKTRAEKPVRRRPQPPPHCRSRSTALCRQKRSLSGASILPSVFPCDSSLFVTRISIITNLSPLGKRFSTFFFLPRGNSARTAQTRTAQNVRAYFPYTDICA